MMCRGRKRWILSVPLRGELWMDAGAVGAVHERGKSLFSAGIVRVSGDFAAQVRQEGPLLAGFPVEACPCMFVQHTWVG